MTKLLAINNYYYRRGGAEVVFFEQNRLLGNTGWQVIPFAMQHEKNLDTPWSRYFVSEIEYGVHYSAAQKLVKATKAVYSLEARRKLRKLLQRTKPQIAHCHNIYHHISPSILPVLKEFNLPTVLTLHDLKITCPAYNMLLRGSICERCKGGSTHHVLLNRCIKDSFLLSGAVFLESVLHGFLGSYEKNIDRFVVPSKFYLEKLAEWGWDSRRFVHIPNFVDVKKHFPVFSPGRHFVYFGRLSREKGVNTLIRAAAHARVELFIVGVGPQERELRSLAQQLGAKVTFSGFLSGEALHEAIRSSRATVLPSEWYENGPISVLESYALGKPVIGASIGGITEMIKQEETGLTFKSGSVEDLTERLLSMARLPDREVVQMGQCARGFAEAEFSAERYLERILALYATMKDQG